MSFSPYMQLSWLKFALNSEVLKQWIRTRTACAQLAIRSEIKQRHTSQTATQLIFANNKSRKKQFGYRQQQNIPSIVILWQVDILHRTKTLKWIAKIFWPAYNSNIIYYQTHKRLTNKQILLYNKHDHHTSRNKENKVCKYTTNVEATVRNVVALVFICI